MRSLHMLVLQNCGRTNEEDGSDWELECEGCEGDVAICNSWRVGEEGEVG